MLTFRTSTSLEDVRQWLKEELNFFRIHLLFFLFIPLISAGIFYAANGQFHIPFIDALFLCYSALTVTGLSTVNLSTLTVFQQAILFVLMGVGNVTIVAWIMVLMRKRYFVEHLEGVKKRERVRDIILSRARRRMHFASNNISSNRDKNAEIHDKQPTALEPLPEHGAQFDPSEGIGAALVGGGSAGIGLGIVLRAPPDEAMSTLPDICAPSLVVIPDDSAHLSTCSPKSVATSFHFVHNEEGTEGFIADAHSFTSSPRSAAIQLPTSPTAQTEGPIATIYSPAFAIPPVMRQRRGVPIPRRQTVIQPPIPELPKGSKVLGQRGKDKDLGGFPGPIQLFQKLAGYYFPRFCHFVERIFTERQRDWKNDKTFSRLGNKFQNLIIYRNSDFDTEELDDDELEQLGGLEYRALDFLSWLVITYFVGIQLISILLIAPWLSTTHAYDDVFDAQPKQVNKPWFVTFQVMGSYTGGGMSLVDAGMVPFQQAYLMIFSMIFSILAGNHGLPIFLRLLIWICTKFVKEGSPQDQSLHFLLDHPRRCFIYLFPSHVTWFLVATLIFFTAIEWVSFIVLDIGLSVTDSLPAGTRALAGLFQSFAVRASGFGIVSLSALAPAFQFLCVVMMYIAVYPVAMSIRSTNVYEEKSLGVFEVPTQDEDEEPNLGENISRKQRIFQYFGWHLRRQVAYDIWWLVFGIFLICIIERTKIMDDDNAPWFNLFRILFELVSAFGGIGLSLGIPTENFAFSGAFGPLSKLVVIVIMVRGRHRGLPVAIDRAILLPEDLVPAKREESALADATNANGVPSSTISTRERVDSKEPPSHQIFQDTEKGH